MLPLQRQTQAFPAWNRDVRTLIFFEPFADGGAQPGFDPEHAHGAPVLKNVVLAKEASMCPDRLAAVDY
jgi:hypothetical protein